MLRRFCNSIALAGFAIWLPCGACNSADQQVTSSPARQIDVTQIDVSDLGLTLSRAVRDDLIDIRSLLESRLLLQRFLTAVSLIGPEKRPADFPTAEHRLAYFINCHNAMVLRSLINLASDGDLPKQAPANFPDRYRYLIDGKTRTAGDVKAEVYRLAGDDWRIRLALFTGRSDGPPLFNRPYLGDMLDSQLEHQTRRAFDSNRVIQIDHGEFKRFYVFQDLFEIQEQLIADYERRLQTANATLLSVALQWADRERRLILNSGVGYEVAPMPANPEIPAIPMIKEDNGNQAAGNT